MNFLKNWTPVFESKWWSMAEKDDYYAVYSARGNQGAACLVVDSEHRVALVKVMRRCVQETCLEIPRGMVDPGENYIEAGIREASEETGYDIRKSVVYDLGLFYPDTGILAFSIGLTLILLEEPFSDTSNFDSDEVEGLETMEWPDFVAATKSGRIMDASSITAAYRAFDIISKHKKD
jgi:ADP-ribose pyrophosphatase